MNDFLKMLFDDEIRFILLMLSKEYPDIEAKVEKLISKQLTDFDVERVTSEVVSALDNLSIEDLWEDCEGYDYESQAEFVKKMVDGALEIFIKRILCYRHMDLPEQEKLFCMAVLKGISEYLKTSESDFKENVEDYAKENFQCILNDWKSHCKDPNYAREMEQFVAKLR